MHGPSEKVGKVHLQAPEREQPDGLPRIRLDEQIDIAVRAESIRDGRAREPDARDPRSAAQS